MYEILYDLIKKYESDISCCNYKKIYDIFKDEYENVNSLEVIEMSNIEAIKNLYE